MLRETQTTICNRALSLVGERPINSIDDKTQLAAVCRTHFDITLRSVLENGQWPCVTVEEPLKKVNYPDYSEEQRFVYAIPVDAALIVRVYPKHERKSMPDSMPWDFRYIPALSGTYIVSDVEEDLMCEYIKDEKDFSIYSASFLRCLSAELAAAMCMDITKNETRMQMLLQYASMLKAEALRNVLNEAKQEEMSWIDPITASRG